MKKFITLIAISLLAFTSCSNDGAAAIKNVDAATFMSSISDPNVQIIDVRTSAEYFSGHLKGALNLDVESGAFDEGIPNLDKSKTYALYCRSGRRATIAAGKLADAGFTNILNFDQGGFLELAAAGAPTE